MKVIKLAPYERLLIEQGTNRYRIVGPGRVWILPWQQLVTRFKIGAHHQTFQITEVCTKEQVLLNLTVRVAYEVDPLLLSTEDLLPKIPILQEQGWRYSLQWQTEYVLRQMLASYRWPDVGQQTFQEQLERRSTFILNERLQKIGLKVNGLYLVHSALPLSLQKALLQAEQNCIEAANRAKILHQYSEMLGHRLSEMMPYIIQWEAADLLYKNGQSHLFLTHATLPLASSPSHRGISQSALQLQQPPGKNEAEVEASPLHLQG